MTITEINDLLLADVQEILENRVISANYDIDNPEEVYEPTQEDLEAEFLVYKAELIAAETERLRVLDLNTRIEALDEANYAHQVMNPGIPNAALYRKNTILDNSDHAAAEANLVTLESKDTELKAAKDSVAYIDNRKSEYPSLEELIVAMFENDQTKITELETLRQAVKAKYPKV